ncbi:hypothetical protein M0R72_07790 [Candidatus Pacearchaeota archaeon]|jgi:hypothetical protein|nr:hypothetical protein [Candidatus Pacearchaeota archaeon]
MGDANITRDQFTEFKTDGSTVLLKYMQQGTYIADSDFNEVGQVSSQRAARHLWNLIKRQNVRFSTGWAITGGTNSVTVSAGDAALLVNMKRAGTLLPTVTDSDKAYIFHLAANTNVTAWTTPAGARTDCLYLDITLPIYDSVDDTTLVNPAIGKETSVDQRLLFAFAKREGYSVPPTAPTDHYYVAIATIARTASATIADNTITNLLDTYNITADIALQYSYLKSDGTRPLTGDLTVTATKTIDGIDLSELTDIIYSQVLEAPYNSDSEITDWTTDNTSCWSLNAASTPYKKKLRISYHKKTNAKQLYVRFEAGNFAYNTGNVRVTVAGCTPVVQLVSGSAGWGSPVQYTITVPISALAANVDANILIEMNSNNGTGTFAIRKLSVWTQVA